MQKQAITETLKANYTAFIEYIKGLDESEFNYSIAEKWTPGQQLLHLYLSVKPLKTGFGLSRFVVRLMFGKAKQPSRTYGELVAHYQKKLADGGKSSAPFSPKAVDFSKKDEICKKIEATIEDIIKKVSNFDEADLDKLRLPHPLLGKITMREMLFFTMYHVNHHKKACIEMLKNNGK
jgi:hypothetical protein